MKFNMNILPNYIFSGVRQFFPNEKHATRIFPQSVLILMYKGVLRFCEDDQEVELNPGEYYFQICNKNQIGKLPSDSPHYYYIHFDGNFSSDGQLPLRGLFDIEKMQPLLDYLINLAPNSTLIEKQKSFFVILTELFTYNQQNTIVEKIRLYLQENYKQKTKIKDLERHFFMTKNQIIKIFKNFYGITPHKYIIELRLNEACELLLSTSRTLGKIAENVGFDDYSIFYKAFYSKFKISPNEYRKLSNKNRWAIIGKSPLNKHKTKKKN